jgi:hypothetical protein
MLGAKPTTDSVSRFYESRLAPNIGLEEFRSLHDSGMSKTHTRTSGVSQRRLTRTIFDN